MFQFHPLTAELNTFGKLVWKGSPESFNVLPLLETGKQTLFQHPISAVVCTSYAFLPAIILPLFQRCSHPWIELRLSHRVPFNPRTYDLFLCLYIVTQPGVVDWLCLRPHRIFPPPCIVHLSNASWLPIGDVHRIYSRRFYDFSTPCFRGIELIQAAESLFPLFLCQKGSCQIVTSISLRPSDFDDISITSIFMNRSWLRHELTTLNIIFL